MLMIVFCTFPGIGDRLSPSEEQPKPPPPFKQLTEPLALHNLRPLAFF